MGKMHKTTNREAIAALPDDKPDIADDRAPAPELLPVNRADLAPVPPAQETPVRAVPHGEIMAMPEEGGLIANWNKRSAEWQASFADADVAGFNRRLAAMSAPQHRLGSLVGKPIIVQDWLVHVVSITREEDGEIWTGMRMVWITPSGVTISTTSEPLINNWADVVGRFGKVTLNPPLRVRVRQVPAKQVGHYFQVDWIEPANRPFELSDLA